MTPSTPSITIFTIGKGKRDSDELPSVLVCNNIQRCILKQIIIIWQWKCQEDV